MRSASNIFTNIIVQFRREAITEKADGAPHNIIGRTRQRRSHHAIFVTYDVEKVELEDNFLNFETWLKNLIQVSLFFLPVFKETFFKL